MFAYKIERRGRDEKMTFFIEVEKPEHAMRIQRALVLDGSAVSVTKVPLSKAHFLDAIKR